MYQDTRCSLIKFPNVDGNQFFSIYGEKQWDVLSLLLFNVFINELDKKSLISITVIQL